MKSRSWFHRFLSTYLPVFYLVVGFLIFLFFMIFSQVMDRQMVNSSEQYAKYITQQIESSLQNIERLMIAEINNNKDVKRFLYEFTDEEENNPYILEKRLFDKFNTFRIDFPLIDSIYLVRTKDNKVLSTSASLSLDSFGDQAFVEQLLDGDIPYVWTGRRPYQLFAAESLSYPVVSLVKHIPLLSKPSGFLVVNVSTSAIQKMVQEMNTLDVSTTTVYDQAGQAIVDGSGSESDPISRFKSAYTNWEIRNGIKDQYNYAIISNLYNGWLVLGIISILFATVIIIYLARRYTSPIDSMMSGITQYLKSKSGELPDILNDNPRFVDKAVNHLIELANQYSDVNKENALHRRKQLFIALISGEQLAESFSDDRQMQKYAPLSQYSYYQIGIIEIDKYSDFCAVYSSRDQYLIKYVMSNVVEEISEANKVDIWSEWLENGRLTMLFLMNSNREMDNAAIHEISSQIRIWIRDNLDYSVSIGIGSMAIQLTEVSQSFNEAEEALSYKTSVGGNKVIPYWELEGNVHAGMFEYLQLIRDIAESFKHRNLEWKDSFQQLMEVVQSKLFLLQDVVNLLNYIIFQISREMSELPMPYQEIWDQTMSELNGKLKSFDSVDDLRDSFIALLAAASEQMEKLRIGRNSQELMQEAKVYIEQNFNNPDLSLKLLSDQFNINQSYLSRLFKEEFSENFVDYLARIRVARAKHLLTTTDDLIQDIAAQVGYLHYFSFNRVFKRIVGVTPGEYRK
jgi:two-component system, response regulator YesN